MLDDWQTAVSILALVVTIGIQLWQQRDTSRQQNSQTDLDKERHLLDVDRTASEIATSQAQLHLDMTVRLREELEAMTRRYESLESQANERESRVRELEADIAALLDEMECICIWDREHVMPALRKARALRLKWRV
jgi:hypothetical protein